MFLLRIDPVTFDLLLQFNRVAKFSRFSEVGDGFSFVVSSAYLGSGNCVSSISQIL
jgi:hypothetical protein